MPEHGLDLLGRMETFTDDLHTLLGLIGATVPTLPRINASPSKPPTLTGPQRDLLTDIYRPDFRRFGYEER